MTVRDQNRFDVALTREGLWRTILVNPDGLTLVVGIAKATAGGEVYKSDGRIPV
jgi:hypothetical protein